MEFLVDQFKFLGLNDREVRVFTALSTFGRMNMTKISSRAGLSRTTVDAIVRRLVGQGLVAQEKVAGHFEYAVKLHEVADRLDWIEKRFRPTENLTTPKLDTRVAAVLEKEPSGQSRVVGQPTSAEGSSSDSVALRDGIKGDSFLKTVRETPHEHELRAGNCSGTSSCVCISCEHKGAEVTHDAMHSMIQAEFLAHTGERATMFLAALVTPEKRMERLEHCFRHAREAKMRLEVLTTTNVSKSLSLHAREVLALLTAYDLRLFFLPPAFCIDSTDLLAFRDVVIIVDHHANVAERIEGERAVQVINHLLRVAREVGWGMDMKMWLEGVIASQK